MNYSREEIAKLELSQDYRVRYIAEYMQLQGRIERLSAIVDQYRKGELPFKPNTPLDILEEQLEAMNHYSSCLFARAALEGVDFNDLDSYLSDKES